ncbi:neuropilin-1-like [Actinia tenebrosa]|uniref:Neuropilin-1-like n=1 Tax=Actinia tenebrosa TaxID=6105 RepID=A0A6P8IBH6_ACTTE|nr:neuropilin-1-like [Actinia tenebrosa]XP_031562155.1 neuropilin-1-like [Actinia tenebrosa]
MMYFALGLLMSPFILHDIWCLDCPSTYAQTNFILKHHVLSSTTVKNYQECYGKCASTTDCHSMNFYDRSQRCELNKGSHLSNPVDLVYNEEGTYSVHDSRSVATCSDKYCGTDTICVVNNQLNNNFECKECALAFGMGVNSSKIPNSAITASSSHGSAHESWRGRLNNYPVTRPYSAGCWAAGDNTVGQYLQVDLGHVVYVTMVATQGRSHDSLEQYVTKYSLAYKSTDSSFVDYEMANTVKVFQANTDKTSIVTHRLPEKIKTRYIRFVVREWYGHISMRAEVYGCQIPA